MSRLFYDGECQGCWRVQHDRTWFDMSLGCRNCGGVVIPCWALPDYYHERPRSFARKPWWSRKDVSGLYAPASVACVQTQRQRREAPETDERGLLSRLLGIETPATRGGG